MTNRVAVPDSRGLLHRLGLGDATPLGETQRGWLLRAVRAESATTVLVRLYRVDPQATGVAQSVLAESLALAQRPLAGVRFQSACGVEDGFMYAVFEDDGFLPMALSEVSNLPIAARLAVARSAADALSGVHDAEVVHGRIDADSLWVDPRRLEARWSDPRFVGDLSASPARPAVDAYGMAPEYAAPEMTGRLDVGIDRRSDLYCLGGVLYALMTGRPPFVSPDPLELMHSHMAREVQPASDLDVTIPRVLSDILHKLLAKMPAARYQSAHGLLFDLDWCLRHVASEPAVDATLNVGERDARGVFALPNSLLGRGREIEAIRSLCERTERGEVHVAILRGPAGSGKSALARHALQGASGFTVTAKFDQIGHNEPYAFITQAVAGLVQLILASPDDEVAVWRQQLVDGLGVNLGLVAGLVPSLEQIVGVQPSVVQIPAAESRHRFRMALQAFLRVFCRPQTPLRLFLDDLQWADAASLELLESMVADTRLGYLLIVAAHRGGPDGPVPAGSLAMLESGAFPVHRFTLAPLDLMQCAEMIALSLHHRIHDVLALARLAEQKTSGNPFFVAQFLRFLHSSRLITFDYGEGRWRWDMLRIQAEGITEDVLALMHRKLDALPTPTRQLLATAALIGGAFDFDTLALATAEEPRWVRRALVPAMEAGLTYTLQKPEPIESTHVVDRGEEIRFVHDQVQQAACGRLDAAELNQLRLAIGWRLHAALAARDDLGTCFAAATNLNRAAALIWARPERVSVARLNLAAGRRARQATAFAQALEYAVAGLAMLDENAWSTDYELALGLYAEAFECAYITGRLAEAERFFASILRHGRTKDAKANAYYTRILVATSLDDSQGAIRLGVEALRMFGHSLSPFPSKIALLHELARVSIGLRMRPAAALAGLPAITEPDASGAIRLLVSICPAAYFQSPNLMSLAALRIVRLSLRYGNANESPFGYVLFGLIAGAVLGRYRQGHAFGQLAMKLAREGRDPVLRTKIVMIFGGFVNFWCEPIESSLQLLGESLQLALSVGDIQYANYSILQTVFLTLARGVPLDQVLAECRLREAFTNQTKDEFTIANRRIREQFVRALRGQTLAADSLDDEGFDELTLVQRSSASTNRTTLAYLTVVKVQLSFLAGNLARALELSDAAERDLEALLSQIMVTEHTFYRGLIAAQVLARGNGGDAGTARLRRELNRAIKRFERWAEHCPANFGSQHLLLKAVRAALFDVPSEATELFEGAIERATELRYLHVRGIACELAARHDFAQGRWAGGRRHVDNAIAAYSSWGATLKVRELQTGGLGAGAGPVPALQLTAAAAPSWHFGELDRLAFDRFVSSSGELGNVEESQELCQVLMRHVIENTGASGGSILCVVQAKRLLVVAHGSSGVTRIEASTSASAAADLVSERLVRYAMRGQTPVAFTLPHEDPRFAPCPHLACAHPASVLCVPLRAGVEPIGALYLENAALQDAFVIERMSFLPVLARQLAIVLQNARAFHVLAEQSRTLDTVNEAVAVLRRAQSQLTKFVPRSVREGIAAYPDGTALVAHEEDLTVLFVDMTGYTELTERIGSSEAQGIVERYFAAYLDAIEPEGGDVNEMAGDSIMAIFRDSDRQAHAMHAVAAASAIQACTQELNATARDSVRVHIGISSGMATVGAKRLEGRAESRWTWTATGSVTNLAARLVQSGHGGDVLISAETARRVGTAWEAASMGLASLKGFDAPVEIFRLGHRLEGDERGCSAPVSQGGAGATKQHGEA